MRRRRRVDYRPFPDELLAPDVPLVRHDQVDMIAEMLTSARWDYVTYLRARVRRRNKEIRRTPDLARDFWQANSEQRKLR